MIAFIKIPITVGLIIGPPLYFGLEGNNVAMGLAIVAGGIAGAFINLDKFQEFKGAGFEAKLKNTIQEAEITIQQVREMMKPVIIFALHQITHSGRGGSGWGRRDSLYDKLVSVAGELEIDKDNEVCAQIDEYIKYHAFDLFIKVYQDQCTVHKNCFLFYQEIEGLFDFGRDKSCPDPSEIEAIFQQYGVDLTSEQKKALADYLNFLKQHPKLKNK